MVMVMVVVVVVVVVIVLVMVVVFPGPMQSLPPNAGGGLVRFRRRIRVPF